MKIYYFTDPMCSWCYGFSPAINQLKKDYPDIELQLIAGGFSPFSKQIVDDEYRDFLIYHWNNVNLKSGRYFDHTMKFVSETFCYDTEPASRALTVIQKLAPDDDLRFLNLMQTSFYVKGKDITNATILAGLAQEIGIAKDMFLTTFHSEKMKQQTMEGFQFSRELGVKGFPTLITLNNGTVNVLARGFMDYASLKIAVDNRLISINITAPDSELSCTGGSCALDSIDDGRC